MSISISNLSSPQKGRFFQRLRPNSFSTQVRTSTQERKEPVQRIRDIYDDFESPVGNLRGRAATLHVRRPYSGNYEHVGSVKLDRKGGRRDQGENVFEPDIRKCHIPEAFYLKAMARRGLNECEKLERSCFQKGYYCSISTQCRSSKALISSIRLPFGIILL